MKTILNKLFPFLNKKRKPQFKHYIVTRFWCHNPNTKRPTHWIKSRVNLFNNFYIKSLNAQSHKNFEVILLVSREYMNYNLESMGFNLDSIDYRIVCAEEYFENPSIILRKKELKLNYIITTRLDSDDMLSKNFVKRIQNSAGPDTIIDHTHSFLTYSNFTKSLRVPHDFNSTFLTTCFNPKKIKEQHCYSSSHHKLQKSFSEKFSLNLTGGLVICHGNNILNKTVPDNGSLSTDFSFFEKDFPGT